MRGTGFFGITLFREMCDHFGRSPQGIFRFSRDMATRGVLRHLFHPRNNGYHLTHHLMPVVPYHHLPAAHRVLALLPVFQERACVCTSYFLGDQAAIRHQPSLQEAP